VGDLEKLVQSFGAEAAYNARLGGGQQRAQRLAAEAESLAQKDPRPYTTAIASLGAGMLDYFTCRFGACAARLSRAQEMLERCEGGTWELATTRQYHLFALMYLGRLGELDATAERYQRDADRRGDLYTRTMIQFRLPLRWLVRDDIPAALRDLATPLLDHPDEGMKVQGFYRWHCELETALYGGDFVEAGSKMEEGWSRMRKTFLMRVPMVRAETECIRARVLLALGQADHLGEVKALAAALRRSVLPVARGWGATLGGIALARSGQGGAADRMLASAIGTFESLDMALWNLAVRRQRAAAQRATRTVEEVDAQLAQLGVRAPGRLAAMLVPTLAEVAS
jgi:hypothetical protein